MDVLSDVLAGVRLTGAIFFDSTFRKEWVAEAPKASIIAERVMPSAQYVFYFHTLLEGCCWAELTDGSVWRQGQYHYEYHYAYRPVVEIVDGKMLVAGMSRAIPVRRLK